MLKLTLLRCARRALAVLAMGSFAALLFGLFAAGAGSLPVVADSGSPSASPSGSPTAASPSAAPSPSPSVASSPSPIGSGQSRLSACNAAYGGCNSSGPYWNPVTLTFIWEGTGTCDQPSYRVDFYWGSVYVTNAQMSVLARGSCEAVVSVTPSSFSDPSMTAAGSHALSAFIDLAYQPGSISSHTCCSAGATYTLTVGGTPPPTASGTPTPHTPSPFTPLPYTPGATPSVSGTPTIDVGTVPYVPEDYASPTPPASGTGGGGGGVDLTFVTTAARGPVGYAAGGAAAVLIVLAVVYAARGRIFGT